MERCPKCNAESPVGQTYCGHCGARIAATEGEEPYWSVTWGGWTGTLTRKAYWTTYGWLIGLCTLFSLWWVVFYISTHALPFLVVAIFFLLMAFFVFVAVYSRARSIESEKKGRF